MLKQFQETMDADDDEEDETIASAGSTERDLQPGLTQVSHNRVKDDRPRSPTPPLDEATVISGAPKRTKSGAEETIVYASSQRSQRLENGEDTVITSFPADSTPEVEDYDRWMQQGKALETMQRYPEALAAYRRAGKIRLDDPNLWLRQGHLLYQLERYEDAIAAYQKGRELQPDNAEFWSSAGKAQIRLERYPAAIDCFDRALKIRPQEPNFWYRRGRALCKVQQYVRAVESFDRAIALKPDFQAARDDRQRVVAQLQRISLAAQPPTESAKRESNTASM